MLHAQASISIPTPARIETDDAATLERLQGVVTRHLKQVAPDETFAVSWIVS